MGKIRKGKYLSCQACGINFYVPLYRINSAKFCSLNCQNHIQYLRPKFKCNECNIEFEDSPSRKGKRKFCSFKCHCEFKIKKKIDSLEKRRLAIYKHRENKNLSHYGISRRKYIFSIREVKCENCGYDEYEKCLDIHHIDGNPSNNLKENLIILCVMCHRKVHRKIIKINNIEIDIKKRRFKTKNDKLNIEDVKKIKLMLNEKKLTHNEIAEKFSVKREAITKIKNNINWKDVNIYN